MNDHLKAHRDFQQVMDDFMSKLHETYQTWLQQRQEQVVNLDTYTPEPSQCQKILICYDDDDDEYSFATQEYLKKFSSAITPDSPKSDSLIMEDKHLDTIPETESDELIKSSVEDLVHTPSESDGISESECDLPICDDSSPKKDEVLDDIISIPPGNGNDHFNAESSLIESLLNRDNVISYPKIDFLFEEFAGELALIAPLPPRIVEADFDPKGDIPLKDNPTPSTDSVLKSPSSFPNSFLEETDTSDNSLPESKIFCFDMEEKRSGNPTSHSDLSLPDYEAFYCDSKPDSGNFTMDVVEDIFDNPTREPRVHVLNVLPTHPTLYLDSNFTPSDDSFGSDLIVSFPFGTRNRIFDLGTFREVQSKRFSSPNEFSISFIRDPLSPVFDTLLPFSSENEEKDFNPGSPSSNEAKSPLFAYVVWIFLPFLTIALDFEASRARGFVHRSLELQVLSFNLGIQYPNLIN
ncbi:hypothetical protein Tco_0216578 [Tanacetum coccineum]